MTRHLIPFLLAALAGTANAGGTGSVVYDPMNHAENITTAMQTTANLAETVKIAELTQLQYLMDLQNYLTSGDIRLLEQQAQYKSLKQLRGELESLLATGENARDRIMQRFREYVASPLDFEDYVSRERQLAERRLGKNAVIFAAEQQALADLDHQHAVVQRLGRQVATATGTNQLLQHLNEHMSLVAAQNSQVIALAAHQGHRAAEQVVEDEARKSAELDARESHRRSMDVELDGIGRMLGD
jgi:P-type conjugative transfer protein TrbJ